MIRRSRKPSGSIGTEIKGRLRAKNRGTPCLPQRGRRETRSYRHLRRRTGHRRAAGSEPGRRHAVRRGCQGVGTTGVRRGGDGERGGESGFVHESYRAIENPDPSPSRLRYRWRGVIRIARRAGAEESHSFEAVGHPGRRDRGEVSRPDIDSVQSCPRSSAGTRNDQKEPVTGGSSAETNAALCSSACRQRSRPWLPGNSIAPRVRRWAGIRHAGEAT